MQEENKVELDTDDVKEEDVSIEEKPKEEKPEKVEVDLGYSDPIKQETKATIRCIPFDENPKELTCVLTGQKAKHEVIFAKAY